VDNAARDELVNNVVDVLKQVEEEGEVALKSALDSLLTT